MSDTTATPASPPPGTVAIGMGMQYIKDLSFEVPNAPQIFGSLNQQPHLSMDVNVASRGMGDGNFESLLTLRLESRLDGRLAFIAELAYAGMYNLPAVPEEQAKFFLLVEAPRLMFPFARQILASAVRDGGFPNIVIQPIDFAALYAARRPDVSAMAPAGAA